jgi:hypothetical protein
MAIPAIAAGEMREIAAFKAQSHRQT